MLKAHYSSLSLLFWTPKVSPNYLQHILSFKNIRRKNSWCSGLCPSPLVGSMRSLVGSWIFCWDDCSPCALSFDSFVIFIATWFVSFPPSSREFDLEFRTPANNIVSLFTYEIVQGVGCELDLCFLSLGSSKDGVLYKDHVWKECLGMTNLFYENPLKRWKTLGGVWKSFLKIFNKDGE